jgi:hypothetical protein
MKRVSDPRAAQEILNGASGRRGIAKYAFCRRLHDVCDAVDDRLILNGSDERLQHTGIMTQPSAA